MRNYKSGLPPPLEKANLSGGWRLLGKAVNPKKICKKNGGGSLFSRHPVWPVYISGVEVSACQKRLLITADFSRNRNIIILSYYMSFSY